MAERGYYTLACLRCSKIVEVEADVVDAASTPGTLPNCATCSANDQMRHIASRIEEDGG